MSIALYCMVATMSVAAWSPIILRFYRSWSLRSNPVSLAICAAIGVPIWMAIAGIWVITNQVSVNVLIFSTAGLSVVAGISAHLAFYWSEKNFPEERIRPAPEKR